MWRRDIPGLACVPLRPTTPTGPFVSPLANWRSFGLLAVLLAAGFGSVAAETVADRGADESTHTGGMEPLPADSGFKESVEAGGVGESRGEVRGGAATWLPHTAQPSWRESASRREVAQQNRGGPWGPPAEGLVLAHRRQRLHGSTSQESYFALKGGGLRIGEDPTTDGVFFGAEFGGALEKVLEVGFSADYYYRSTDNSLVVSESNFENLPIEVTTFEHTAAHLVPLGLTLRLRLPIAGDVVTPIVSTTLSYEMLFLENVGGTIDDPLLASLAEHETFTGFGWQAAGGLGVRLSPTVGVFGEAGYHWGSPAQGFYINGIPVDMKVRLDGAFLRGGLRFAL
ncbi:MAG TPA: hypothetical protein VFD07_03580 [Candidatus Krumholzibacteria bacterium]|nr:hypothetical protein [Candidatus Krumholzibacteria bacterium]